MKITPITSTGISGHQVDFTFQDLLVLGGLQHQLEEGVKQLEEKNHKRKTEELEPVDTVRIPSQVLTQCLIVISKIVGDVQNLEDTYNELFDIEPQKPQINPQI